MTPDSADEVASGGISKGETRRTGTLNLHVVRLCAVLVFSLGHFQHIVRRIPFEFQDVADGECLRASPSGVKGGGGRYVPASTVSNLVCYSSCSLY